MEQKVIGRISVEDLKLTLKKGLYSTETLLENEFSVSSTVEYALSDLKAGEYLDYASLADIITNNMLKPNQLLESVAMDMIQDIIAKWPFAQSVSIKIRKKHPHFNQALAAVVVDMIWVR